jgi:hypothetical protein
MPKRSATVLLAFALAVPLGACAGGTPPQSNAELEQRVEDLEASLAQSNAAAPTTAPAPAGSDDPATTAPSTSTTTTTAPGQHQEPPINRVSNGGNDTGELSLHAATATMTDWYPRGSVAIDDLAAAIDAVDAAAGGTSRSALIDACFQLRDAADAAEAVGPIPDMVADRYWGDALAALRSSTDWCYGTADGDPTAATNLRSEIESGLTSLRAVASVLS